MRMLSPAARKSLEAKVQQFHEQAKNDPAGRVYRYLTERGIGEQQIEKFRLGYTGDTGDGTRYRLAIPYLTPAGPVEIRYRCLEDHSCKEVKCPKYLSDEGGTPHLFNAQALLNASIVVVPEGELDSIAGDVTGVPHIGRPGTEAWKVNPHWRWCFDSCDEVIFVGDGDERKPGEKWGVGEKFAREAAADLRTALPHVDVRAVTMPFPHDVNSFIQTFGQTAYLERLGLLDDGSL